MTDWCWWVASVLGLAMARGVACSSTDSSEGPECTPNRFKSCDAGCGSGRGVQQCVEEDQGSQRWEWSSCSCVVLDGSFVEPDDEPDSSPGQDAAADAQLDGSPDQDAAADAQLDSSPDQDAAADAPAADLDAEADGTDEGQ